MSLLALIPGGSIVDKVIGAIPARAWLVILVVAALATSHLWYGHTRYNAAEAIGAKKTAAVQAAFDDYRGKVQAAADLATRKAKAAEQAQRDAFAAIAAQHDKAIHDANAKHDAVVAGLRAGTVRLRQHWQGCQAATGGDLPEAAGAAGVAHDSADLRDAGAGDLVRIGALADAQVTGLQAALQACAGSQ